MNIEVIHDSKIKIVMSNEELKNFSVTYDQLSSDDPSTRTMISRLLSVARSKVGFEHKDKKLFIETFPDIMGGCILYFTVVSLDTARLSANSKKKPMPDPIVLSFRDLDVLYRACEYIYSTLSHKILKSSLFACYSSYYLILHPICSVNEEIGMITGEFLCEASEGVSSLRHLNEHGKELLGSGALERMAQKT